MGFPPKIIVVFSLVQFSFISIGYLLTCAGLHRFDKIFGDLLQSRSEAVDYYLSNWACLTTLSFAVRDHGLWTLSLPVIWCVIWILRSRDMNDLASVGLPESTAGIVLTLVLALTFLLSSFHAFRMAFGSFST